MSFGSRAPLRPTFSALARALGFPCAPALPGNEFGGVLVSERGPLTGSLAGGVMAPGEAKIFRGKGEYVAVGATLVATNGTATSVRLKYGADFRKTPDLRITLAFDLGSSVEKSDVHMAPARAFYLSGSFSVRREATGFVLVFSNACDFVDIVYLAAA